MFFCLVFAMPLCVSVYMCLVVTCCDGADRLALVCGHLLSGGIINHLLHSNDAECELSLSR